MQQSAPTQTTLNKLKRLLDYVATYPDATIRYRASKMVLQVDTDAAYLVLPKARSCCSGHYYLTNDDIKNPPKMVPSSLYVKQFAMLSLPQQKRKLVELF